MHFFTCVLTFSLLLLILIESIDPISISLSSYCVCSVCKRAGCCGGRLVPLHSYCSCYYPHRMGCCLESIPLDIFNLCNAKEILFTSANPCYKVGFENLRKTNEEAENGRYHPTPWDEDYRTPEHNDEGGPSKGDEVLGFSTPTTGVIVFSILNWWGPGVLHSTLVWFWDVQPPLRLEHLTTSGWYASEPYYS